jgi:predicted ABC-type sugar transport system permease subunit
MASDVSSGDAPSGGGTATREPDAGFDQHARPILGPLAVLLLSIIAFSIISGRFLSAANLRLVLAQVTVIGVLALGQTLVILTAGARACGFRNWSSTRCRDW